jgi:hypothetical protein
MKLYASYRLNTEDAREHYVDMLLSGLPEQYRLDVAFFIRQLLDNEMLFQDLDNDGNAFTGLRCRREDYDTLEAVLTQGNEKLDKATDALVSILEVVKKCFPMN